MFLFGFFFSNCSKVWHISCPANRLCVVYSFKSFCLNVALGSRRLLTTVFCLFNCFYRKLIHNLHIATEKNHNLTPFPSKHINIYSIKRPNKKPYGLQFHELESFNRFSSPMRSYGFPHSTHIHTHTHIFLGLQLVWKKKKS